MSKTIPGVFLEAGIYTLEDLKSLIDCASLVKIHSWVAHNRSLYPQPDLEISLSAWDLPPRVINQLRFEGIHTVAALIECTYSDFLKMPNIGRKSTKQLIEEANKHGFQIKGQP
jgi:DNA-directed RNA polymerase alpha subunit